MFKSFFSKIFYFNESNNKLEEIKEILKIYGYSLKDEDLNIFDKNFSYSSEKIKLKEKYTLFHFDENDFSEYISKYIKIEPSLINW